MRKTEELLHGEGCTQEMDCEKVTLACGGTRLVDHKVEVEGASKTNACDPDAPEGAVEEHKEALHAPRGI